MLRTKFVPTILVIILGVNLGAWTLSVATAPNAGTAPLTIPISTSGIDAHSQSASAASTQPTPAAMEDIASPAIVRASSTPINSTASSTDTSATSTR